MDIHAIVSHVLESDNVVLTAYQIQNLLAIIDELPDIEKRALETVSSDEDYKASSIAKIAINNLKLDEVFCLVAKLGTMSCADLIDILTALSTGHEDDFGYWQTVDDEEREIMKATRPISAYAFSYTDAFLYSQLCYGKPHPDHDSCWVDDTGSPFASSYIKMLQIRGISVEDPEVVWLHLDCQTFIEKEFRATTVIDLLRAFKDYDIAQLRSDRDKEAYDKIDSFFEYWLGEDWRVYK